MRTRATKLPITKKRLRLIQDILQFERALQADGDAKGKSAGWFLGAEPLAVGISPVGIEQRTGLNLGEHGINDFFIGFRGNAVEADGAEGDGYGSDLIGAGFLLAGGSAGGIDARSIGCGRLGWGSRGSAAHGQAIAFAERFVGGGARIAHSLSGIDGLSGLSR